MAKASSSRREGRYNELKLMLKERRQEVAGEIREGLRDNRDENAPRRGDKVRDFAEDSEVSAREDVDLALLQMKVDTLSKIDQALGRLMQGLYGYCAECGEEISENRLRALPFALRCKDCEEARETAERRELAGRGRAFGSLFVDRGPASDSR